MKRGRYSQRSYQYVLECRVPAPPSELKTSVVSEEEDEEDLEVGELDDPIALVAELGTSESEESSREPGVEVIRCVGDDVMAMEIVLPGERSEPLPGQNVEVEAAYDGRCLLRVSDRQAQVFLFDERGEELPEADDLRDGRSIEVPHGARAKVSFGERFIIVRSVGLANRSSHRGLKTGLAIVGLVVAALAVIALAVSFLQWAIEL